MPPPSPIPKISDVFALLKGHFIGAERLEAYTEAAESLLK
ncbi:646_t:CDS:2 [Funneliformis mosseae]|uniref:646_t:CDS:1 n=1 Tax=Funneliformis mosseae TaxID=27381 RepID=A0A9N9FXQ7_FUNMO|nr:646_t:CDS:2 [Funneliformis mosseae]